MPTNADKKWVLVTGASTGIGRAITEYLAKNGFNVYACARNQSDLDDLAGIANVKSIKVDVTSPDDVKDAIDLVNHEGTGLFGLVNNAGIAVAGPLVDITDEDFKMQFEVNMFGVHRMTRAFFPLLLESKGRIVMMSSDSGFFATPLTGAYCASKHAIEGYADSLRRELFLVGVKVVIIEPGRIKTPIWEKNTIALDKYKDSIFAKVALKLGADEIKKGIAKGLPPVEVAKKVYSALVAKKPHLRYSITDDPVQFKLTRVLPPSWIDKMVQSVLKKYDT
ncbi:MAG TPA: SDR family oxidoreductase [Candidatus Lokiarchaeia archaeon]|nr:SDR family oxidoreductase [Candidatus Lokiarchaeia archaeon]